MGKELVNIDCEIIRETDAAYLVEAGKDQYWLPKSQIEYEGAPSIGKTLTIGIPRWLAEEKGMV